MLVVEKLSLPNGRNVSLKLNRGDVVFIKGPNGSGKSLLLKGLSSLIPCAYETFMFHEKKLNDWSYSEYRSKVMYVSPLPYLSSEESVEEFLRAPRGLKIFKDHQFQDESLVRELGLAGMKLSHLSSGQKQILSLVRSVSLATDVLLLDETMSHLDPEKMNIMENLIWSWKERNNGTVVLVSHDSAQMNRMKGDVLELIPDGTFTRTTG